MKEQEQAHLYSVIEEQYGIGSILVFTPTANAGQNGAFRVETTSGIYFLRQYRTNIHSVTVNNEAPLIDFLATAGLPVPKVIRNTAGKLVTQTLDGRYFLMQDYISGDHYPSEGTELGSEQILNAAKTLAKFHKIMRDANPGLGTPADITDYTTGSFFSVSKAENIWNTALTIIRNKMDVDTLDLQINSVAPQKLEALSRVDEIALNRQMECMPSVLAHGDFIPQNIIFKGDEVVGIVDWELARHQPRVWELLRAVCSFCKTETTEIFNTPLDLEKAKAFIAAYESLSALTPDEKEIMFYLAFLASLFPYYFLSTKYVNQGAKVDRLLPKDISHWQWWQNNFQRVQKDIFGL